MMKSCLLKKNNHQKKKMHPNKRGKTVVKINLFFLFLQKDASSTASVSEGESSIEDSQCKKIKIKMFFVCVHIPHVLCVTVCVCFFFLND